MARLGGKYLYFANSLELFIKTYIGGWRGGSAVKGTYSSFRGVVFGSQHPLGGSRPSITPDPEDPAPSSTPSSDLHGH